MHNSKVKFSILILSLILLNPLYSQNDTLTVDDLLNKSIDELLKIKIISATRHEENAFDIPATIYIVGAKEIEKYGFFDLKQVLFHTPGIEYSYPHSWLQGGQRGITENWSKSKLLINGIDINLLYTGEAFIGNQFSLENVQQIEIIQGPGSVIYGADAFSGTINIVTKKPTQSGIHANFSNSGGISQDGMQYYRMSSLVSGCFNKFSFALNIGHTKLNDADFTDFVKTNKFSQVNNDLRVDFIENRGEPYVDLNKAHNAHLHLNYDLNNKNNFQIDFLHLFDKDGGGQEYAELSFQHFKSIRQQEFISLKYKHEFNETHSINLRTQYRYDKELNDWIYQDTVSGGSISPVYSWDVVGSTSQNYELFWNINAEKLNNYTIAGSGYRLDRLANIYFEEETFDYLNEFLNPDNFFVFLQTQQYFFNNKIYAILGVRKDFHNIYDAPITFRGGLTYKMNKFFRVKYFYNEAFRAPTLFDLEINDRLLPENNNTHEVNITYQPTQKLFVQTSAYYSRTHNLITTIKDPGASSEDIFISVNKGEQFFHGNETILKYLDKYFTAEYWINYTHSNEMLKISPLKSSLKLAYCIKKRNNVSLLFRYASKTETDYYTGSFEIDTKELKPLFTTDIVWYLNNIALMKSLRADFTFTIQNVFNSENYYANFRGNDPICFKEQARSFWVKLNLKI